jgi:acyl-CoA thioester hydrolase
MDTEVLQKMTTKDFVVQIVPRWADMDLNQHMRHSAFADWASYARTEWLHINSFTMEKLVELKITPIMFEDRTRYLKEVLLGERIHLELQLAGADREGSQWFVRHIFRRGETVCAVYEAQGAWFNIATRRVVPAPPGLLEAYSNLKRTDDFAELRSGESVKEE